MASPRRCALPTEGAADRLRAFRWAKGFREMRCGRLVLLLIVLNMWETPMALVEPFQPPRFAFFLIRGVFGNLRNNILIFLAFLGN